MDVTKVRELKCVDDINTFFDLNKLDEISDEEEINEFVTELSNLGKSYRDVHIDLSSGLSENEYTAHYPKHQEFRSNVNKSIQDAKRKLRNVKRDQTKSKSLSKENDLLSEKKFLMQRSDDYDAKFQAIIEQKTKEW